MSGHLVFVPEDMYAFAADAEVWADDVRATGRDAQRALDAFASSSSEFVPALPAHGAAMGSLADQATALAENVAVLGAAAEEADRVGITDFRDLLLTVAAGVRVADAVTGVPDAVARLVRTSVHGTRALDSAADLWRISRRYGDRPMPDIAAIRAETPGGRTLPRREIRSLQRQKYRELKKARARLRGARAGSVDALHSNRPVTGVGQRVRTFMTTSRTGRVISRGGRVLGVAGTLVAAADTGMAIYEGDTERAVTSGLATAGGALMLTANPVGIGVGAAIVVGVTVYENWDTISGWAEDRWDAVSNVGSSVVDGARGLLDSIF